MHKLYKALSTQPLATAVSAVIEINKSSRHGRLGQVFFFIVGPFGRRKRWSRSRKAVGRLEERQYIGKTQGSQPEVVGSAGGRHGQVVVRAGLTVYRHCSSIMA